MNTSLFIYPGPWGLEVFSLKYMSKSVCFLACAVLMVGATFAMSWSSESMLTDDSYIVEGVEDSELGTEEILWVSSDPAMESWLGFETPLMIEALGIESSDDVESATLKVYAKEVEAEGEVELHFYSHGFYEDTIAWDEDKPEYDDEADDVIEVSEEGWYEFDATNVVKKAIDECTTCPFSVVLVAKGDASVGFASKEDSEGNGPLLTVSTSDE
jgi:hypothetical protein